METHTHIYKEFKRSRPIRGEIMFLLHTIDYQAKSVVPGV